MEASINTRLSYSSSSLLDSCEQRYFHYKVAETPIDIDASRDSKAFMIGKAFHHVLEMNNHTREDLYDHILDSQSRYALEEHETHQIHAMIYNYLRLHEASKLKVVKCEYAIVDECFIGYVDAVMTDDDGNWWICDLKTAARLAPDLSERMAKDTQLNLYAAYRGVIAQDLGLDTTKFKGCLYRVTTKTRLKFKKSETSQEYISRVFNNIETVELEVKLEDMDPEGFMERHMINHKRSLELRAGEVPKKNFKNCYSFFRPCEYYAQCHGKIFSEADTNTIVRRFEDY